MLKELRNEVKIKLSISTDSPLLIRAAEKNILDPSLPDSQVTRQSRHGESIEYIPGSSLKGVFRTRAEQLLRSQGYYVLDTFAKYDSELETEDGKKAYEQACTVGKLFGNLYVKSRILFTDAFPVLPVKTAVRTGVGIDRITGGARGGALFNSEVIEEGAFETTITLQNFELWQLALVLYLINDLNEGYIKLGASTSRGLGKVNAVIQQIQFRRYGRNLYKKNPDTNTISAPLLGYEERDFAMDSKNNPLHIEGWKEDLFGIVLEDESFEKWFGFNSYLANIKWPSKSK